MRLKANPALTALNWKVVAGFHTGDRSVGMETDAHLLHDSG